jgi:hypothetical protein
MHDATTATWFLCLVLHFQKLQDKDCVSSSEVNRSREGENLQTKLWYYRNSRHALSAGNQSRFSGTLQVSSHVNREQMLTQSTWRSTRKHSDTGALSVTSFLHNNCTSRARSTATLLAQKLSRPCEVQFSERRKADATCKMYVFHRPVKTMYNCKWNSWSN